MCCVIYVYYLLEFTFIYCNFVIKKTNKQQNIINANYNLHNPFIVNRNKKSDF